MRVLIKKSVREGAVWSCPILGRHRDMDKEACTIMVACKIFLASLLIFSAGSQVLDTVKDKDAGKIFPELDGTALRRKKGVRSMGSENKSAPGDSSRPRNYAQKKVCPPGTYRYVYGCARCKTCKENEKVLEECAEHRNRKCACREGYFKVSQFSPEDFNCKKCLNCSSLNQLTLQACREHKDAQCGPCVVGFCKSGSACEPCPTDGLQSVTRASTAPMGIGYSKSTTPTPRILMVEQCNVTCKIALAACGCVFLLGGALAVCYKKKATISARDQPLPAPDLYTAKPHFGSPIPSLPETAPLVDKVPAHHRSLQQGRKLYTVINAVPVRRWKEFVRGLGLQDGEIELVELEHSQFREQQYEMLKRWCQRRGASVDAVLATLEAMQLGGCAQELREQLEVEPLQGAALQLG